MAGMFNATARFRACLPNHLPRQWSRRNLRLTRRQPQIRQASRTRRVADRKSSSFTKWNTREPGHPECSQAGGNAVHGFVADGGSYFTESDYGV
jgi:hypothetical protein